MTVPGGSSDTVAVGVDSDTVIVGGGLIGCALAAELAARGQRVTVLERGEPGDEASGAAAGMLSPQADAREPGSLFELGLESRGLYPAWIDALRRETGVDPGFRRLGLLRCAFRDEDADGLFSSFAWQLGRGLAVEDRTEPALRAEIDGRLSPEVRRAVFFPEEGAVEPRTLTRAAWLCAAGRGARVLTGTAVRRFLLEGGACRGVETDAGTLRAGAVVDAAGAWAAFDEGVTFPIPVHPVRGQIVRLRIDGPPLRTQVSSDEVYLVPRPEGEIIVGSTLELVGFRKAVTAEAIERLLAAAIRLIPALRAARVDAAWSGLRPGTPDGLPILGESPVPGLFFATGHFRNGILLAPVTAALVADVVTGGARRDLSAFSVARFSPAACTA